MGKVLHLDRQLGTRIESFALESKVFHFDRQFGTTIESFALESKVRSEKVSGLTERDVSGPTAACPSFQHAP
jgi:hypothetical protein